MWDDHPSVIINEQAEPEPELEAPPIPRIVEEDTPSIASEGAADSVGSPAQVEQPPVAQEPRRSKRLKDNREASDRQWSRKKGGRLRQRKFNFAKMSQQEFRQAKSNMSKSDKQKHFASMCAQAPPKACHMSRKKRKYRQRMAHR